MINHIVTWKLQDRQRPDAKEVLQKVKEVLEALHDAVPGIISLKVVINEMESSSVDAALISQFETKEALDAYQVSEGHKKASEYVGSVFCGRACIDYKELS